MLRSCGPAERASCQLICQAAKPEVDETESIVSAVRLSVPSLAQLQVCTHHYGEKTGSTYSSYRELRVAYENDLDIMPLRMDDVYPPSPPCGGDHDYDPYEAAPGLIALALPNSRKFVDCRTRSLGCRLTPRFPSTVQDVQIWSLSRCWEIRGQSF